ncbi:L-lysine 6-transaminase [Gracilimonas sediminicola]|uniref:L-lysine-epsilon aminotransferase n=1 Tax=Gracilimonas sediminicola TaxID=2952158 RepID=A0A9X2L1Y4_9BACT|nr:L-lysine 6-transaminase [Gracilimonas sediminicola]MCP9290583.1 L-lysine 6-transaminase [Gracilimonas sediminicola]
MTITPDQVRSVLSKHMLTDGYEMVLDLEESEGPYLYDSKSGKRYLDFFTFFASNPLGMNHPKLAQDDDFIAKLGRVAINKPSNSDIYTKDMAEFMESFDRVGIPDYMPYSFFISGGALAVENAMKVAFDWKVQKNFEKGYREEKGHKVLHFEKAFHGRSGYTLSVTNTVPNKVKYFPKFDWPRVISPAMTYPATKENVQHTAAQEQLALAQAERYFEQFKDDIACILIEPIQGEGGDRHFRQEFHQALRDLADKHEALLIYDEVQTGVGMTGKFWAHEHYVKPDILAFGKKAQVCGILAGKRVDEVETNCFHVSSRINSTWGGNLVDMVRFGRILDVIEEENLVDNAAKVGNYLQTRLEALADQHEYFTNPRGKGLFCAIDLPDGHSRDAVIKECVNNGLMILSCGPNTVRFRPPLTITQDQIDEGLDILEKAYKTSLDKCPVAD